MNWKLIIITAGIYAAVTACFELLLIRSKSRIMVELIRQEAMANKAVQRSKEYLEHELETEGNIIGATNWHGYNEGRRAGLQEALMIMGYNKKENKE